MPSHPRASGGDTPAAGRARQRLKLAANGYFTSRHGVDADIDLARGARGLLRKMAFEYGEAFFGSQLKKRFDLSQGDDEMLQLAALAYASSRHGIDADVGMAREGLALLCQAAIDFYESLPKEDSVKRSADPRLQIGERS